jgi:hypothetical protein
MRSAAEIEQMRRAAIAAWQALEDNEVAGWEPDGATVALVDAYASAVGDTFEQLEEDLVALLGCSVSVDFSENGDEDWCVPVFASTEDGRYALADAAMRGWRYWLAVQLVQDRNGRGVL